jgi:hypothetical protein
MIAVANSILTAGYYMLQRATTYQELGPDYFDKRNTLRATHRLVKSLEALGHRVILEPRFIDCSKQLEKFGLVAVLAFGQRD